MPLAKYAYKESVDDIIPDDVNFIESIYYRIFYNNNNCVGEGKGLLFLFPIIPILVP